MMHCEDWEQLVALHVGGELAAANPAEAASVEKHLAQCPGCHAFWSGMKQSLELLQEAHVEALAPGIFTAMRERVMADLKPCRLPWWRRGWVPASAVAVVLVLLLMGWPMRRVETLPPRVAAVIPPAPEPPAQALRVGQARSLAHPAHVTKRRAAPRAARNMPRQPLMVRLVTDDPNVVIYWIAD